MPASDFLTTLKDAADRAAGAETAFRREIAARTAALEQERAVAFRRLNLMRAVVESIDAADSEASALAACRSTLRGRLGWSGESEARGEVLARFDAVARALHGRPPPAGASSAACEEPDAAQTLAAFEAWYAETRGTPFWRLFENVMPETPLVDF